MEFVCTKNELNDILNIVQRAVTPKSTLPVMECIKIDCNHNTVVFTGNNLEICIEYKADIEVKEGGCIALPSKIFGDIARKLPDGNVTLSVNEENNVTKIKGGISEFNIQGLISNEFPEPPSIEEKYSFTVEEYKLKNIIKRLIPFVAVTEGKRPTLTGSLFEIKKNEMTVVASDGHRLGVVKETIKDNDENMKFIIPGSTLRELLKILRDDESSVKVTVSDKHVMLEFEHFKVFTRLIDGDYLRYEPIIAANNTIRMEVNSHELRDSLERAMLIINDDDTSPDKRMPVRLSIGYDKIEVSCMTSKGKVNDAINAKIEGGELVIGFNCRFLIDAIASCDEEKIEIDLSTPVSGCFMRSLDEKNSNYVFMILPVRLYN